MRALALLQALALLLALLLPKRLVPRLLAGLGLVLAGLGLEADAGVVAALGLAPASGRHGHFHGCVRYRYWLCIAMLRWQSAPSI